MQCEICGIEIRGQPHKITIDGSELTTCAKCSQYGNAVNARTPVSRKVAPVAPTLKRRPSRPGSRKDPLAEMKKDELIEDYDKVVREARVKLGLTQEELAIKIKEKASLLKKIEKAQIVPEDSVRVKLEHALDIELTERINSEDWSGSSLNTGTTLGDIVKIKKK